MATLTGDSRSAIGTNALHAAPSTMYQAVLPSAASYDNQESSNQIVDQNLSSAFKQDSSDVNNGLVYPHSGSVSDRVPGNCQTGPDPTQTAVVQEEQAPTINIVINNVVCSFATRCHLNLKRIATEGTNVIYRRENGMVSMKIRRPYTTASIWSSGKITCTGATSEEDAKVAARKFTRLLQRLNFKVRLTNFRVVNVLGTCTLPFGIRITLFSRHHKENASYEPELHPGVTYKIKNPKATLKIFSTGSITVTAPCVMNVQTAIEHIFPLVYKFRMDDMSDLPCEEVEAAKSYIQNPALVKKQKMKRVYKRSQESDESLSEESDEEDYLSDESSD